jgi:hypothetical protein
MGASVLGVEQGTIGGVSVGILEWRDHPDHEKIYIKRYLGRYILYSSIFK